MAEIDPVNLCLSTSECCIEVRPNFNPPDWCFEMGIDISAEGKEETVLPLGERCMCRPLSVNASWEQGYILLGGVCVLWSSLQPVWVLACYLLGSYTSAAGGVAGGIGITTQQSESLVFAVALELLGDLAATGVAAIHQVYKLGMASTSWGVSCSEDIPASLHSAEWKCKAWAPVVVLGSTCCDPSVRPSSAELVSRLLSEKADGGTCRLWSGADRLEDGNMTWRRGALEG